MIFVSCFVNTIYVWSPIFSQFNIILSPFSSHLKILVTLFLPCGQTPVGHFFVIVGWQRWHLKHPTSTPISATPCKLNLNLLFFPASAAVYLQIVFLQVRLLQPECKQWLGHAALITQFQLIHWLSSFCLPFSQSVAKLMMSNVSMKSAKLDESCKLLYVPLHILMLLPPKGVGDGVLISNDWCLPYHV